MSEFYTGLCFGSALGFFASVAALYVADLVSPTLPAPHKEP